MILDIKIGKFSSVTLNDRKAGNETIISLKQRYQKQQSLDFESCLKETLNKNSKVIFSKHARKRMQERKIELNDTLVKKIDDALNKGSEKNRKDMILIDREHIFVVNVPNRTVVTAMYDRDLRENIITNIDGAMIL